MSNLSEVTYPDSWNTTTTVTLGQVYEDIISSLAFTTVSAGHEWVVYSWDFIQGGSTNTPPNTNDIVGYFILTNTTSPNGYVTAYYNIANGDVAVSPVTTTVTVNCTIATGTNATATGPDLAAACSGAVTSNTGLYFPNAEAATTSPAIICIQFYYFNSTAPLTLNMTNELEIGGVRDGSWFDGGSNFTISASQSQLIIGGPENQNEGAVVAFSVMPKPETSGTYELDLSAASYMIGSQEPLECGYYGTIAAGSGMPDYVLESGCITYSVSGTTGTQSITIPGVNYPILPNNIYFCFVMVINATE